MEREHWHARRTAKSSSSGARTTTMRSDSTEKGPDAKSTATSVEVTLDICKGRPAAGINPLFLSPDEKIAIGRNLMVQDTAGHFARAQLVVQVKPTTFTG